MQSYLGMDATTSSVSPEQPNRISSFVSSSYRPWTLMQGAGYTPVSPPPSATFLTNLPQAGDCALGGCADVYSEYAHACGVQQCGGDTPHK